MRSLVERHPLPLFFVLAYVLSWWALPFGVFLPFGPLLAALAVTAIADGRAGLRALRRQILRRPSGRRWYLIAVAVPLSLATVAVVGGADVSTLSKLAPWYLPALLFTIRLVDPLDGPGGEELGWRGFALARLQVGRSPLQATAILAALVAGWHVPLVFLASEKLPPIFLLATIGVTFFYSWLYNTTGGSVGVTIVSHAAEGVIKLGTLGLVGTQAAHVNAIYTIGWVATGLASLVAIRGIAKNERVSFRTPRAIGRQSTRVSGA